MKKDKKLNSKPKCAGMSFGIAKSDQEIEMMKIRRPIQSEIKRITIFWIWNC